MRPPVLILCAAIVIGAYALATQVAFMAGMRFRLRRARRLAPAGRHREAERVLNRVAADCTRFRQRHSAWVRATDTPGDR